MTHEMGSFYSMTRLGHLVILIMHYELLKAYTGVYTLCNKYQCNFLVVMVTIDCMAHLVIVMAFPTYMNIIIYEDNKMTQPVVTCRSA